MKTFFLKLLSLAALGTAFFTASAHAHALWIEPAKDGGYELFFGEYADGVREKSGGKLDDIAHLEAWTASDDGKTALKPAKGEDRFRLPGSGAAAVAQDVALPVKDMTKYKSGVAKPHLYARFVADGAAGLKPELRLDLVPSANGVTAYFDNTPLAGAKVIETAPNGWSKELKTDAEGGIAVDRPWPGIYVFEATHVVQKPGSFENMPYEVERHRATLALEKK